MSENREKESAAAKSVKSRLSVAMAQGRAAQSTQRLQSGADGEAPAPADSSTPISPSAAGAPSATPAKSLSVTGPTASPARRVAPRKRAERKSKPGTQKSDMEKATRQRVRPETRTQMLERLTNPLVTLHEASILLRVCTATVRRYSNSGQLAHLRTEGGQRRFYLKDVLSLLKEIEGRKK